MRTHPTYVLAAMLLLATLYFYQDPDWNGNSRLDAVKAVVEEGRFQIDDYQAQPDWKTMDKSVYAGHFYTDKGIGSSLLAVPFYFVMYRIATLWGLALGSAFVKHALTAIVMGSAFTINGILLFRIGRILVPNPWKAALAALAVSLGTLLWPYSAVYYGHVPAAMFVTAAFYLLLKLRVKPDGASAWTFFGAGLLVGLAFITEFPTALISLGLLAYALYVLWGKPRGLVLRAGLLGSLGVLLPISLMLAYDAAVYGSIFRFGYSHVAVDEYQQGLEQGVMGIGTPDLRALYHFTFDPRFGVFWQSPVLLLALVGLGCAIQQHRWRAEVLLSAYSILSIFLMNAGFFMWWGGASVGARYLIPALPFFVVPLVLVPDGLNWLLGALTVLSGAQMLIPLLGDIQIHVNYLKTVDQFRVDQVPYGFSLMYQYGLPRMFRLAQLGESPWTLGSAIGLSFQASTAALIAVESALARYLWRVASLSRSAEM